MSNRQYVLLLFGVAGLIAAIDVPLYFWMGPRQLLSHAIVYWATRCPLLAGLPFLAVRLRADRGTWEWRLALRRMSFPFMLGVGASHVFVPVHVNEPVAAAMMPPAVAWAAVLATLGLLALLAYRDPLARYPRRSHGTSEACTCPLDVVSSVDAAGAGGR